MNPALVDYTFDVEGTSAKLIAIKMCKNNYALLQSVPKDDIPIYPPGTAWDYAMLKKTDEGENICWLIDSNGSRISPFFDTDAIFSK